MSSDAWYYSVGGQQTGPFSSAELRQMLADGAVSPEVYVWHEGLPEWQALSAVPGLADRDEGGSPPGTHAGSTNVLGYHQALAAAPPDATSHYTKKYSCNHYTDTANVAMVLATFGLFFLRILFAPVSLMMGIWALAGLCRHAVRKGRAMAIAAIALGAAEIGLIVLAIYGILIF